MGVSVCRKTSIVIKKWGLGRSPKQGEGGSPTLSPFPRGRGLGLGLENLLHFYKNGLFLQTEGRGIPSPFLPFKRHNIKG